MKYWVTCPADVEEYVTDERERPRNYEEHFYPCYIKYEEPWDLHFCGNFYFMNESREEAIAMRKTNLINYINERRRQIENAKSALKELNKY
jgi:hypothetical protein